MKTIFRSILYLSLFILVGCSPQGIPKHIQQAQNQWQDQQQKRTLQDPGIIEISPIESIPDTVQKKFLGIFNVQSSGNWGYEFSEVDKYEKFIEAEAKRTSIVFVFDTGADKDHPNIKDAILEGRNFTTSSSSSGAFEGQFDVDFVDPDDWNDGHGHGTHVASTVLGKSRGSQKIGIAEPLLKAGKIKLVVVKILGDNGRGYTSQFANGVRWANSRAKYYTDQGNAIIYNFSLGSPSYMGAVDDLLKDAEELGVLLNVCANGNTGRESNQFPASSKYTESAVALKSDGKRATFSTIGEFSTFAAPGQSIYAAYKDGGYARLSGTSMASPHLAAYYAIYMSCKPEINARQAKAHFRNVAIDMAPDGRDKWTGFGVIKMSKLFATPPPDDEPDQPPVDEPDQPDPPKEEPTPDYPTSINEYKIYKNYAMTWSTMDDINNRKKLVCNIQVKIKHRLGATKGALEALKLSDSFFKNRGLVLPSKSTEIDAAYWTAHFYRLILKKQADIRIIDMDIDFGGVKMKAPKLPSSANTKAKRMPLITYQW